MPDGSYKERIERISRQIRTLASSQLHPTKYGMLAFPNDPRFIPPDHLTYLHRTLGAKIPKVYVDRLCYGTTKDAPLIRLLSEIEAREAHIHRRLGHIVVNPHDEFNTQALVESYCFACQEETDRSIHSTVANWNEESAQAFIGSVIEIAEKQSALLRTTVDRQAKGMQTDRTVILHGPRGAGKTFFENYLLSRFSSLLDQRRVIWVRINLVNQIGYDERLVDWIQAQAAKIIMRYYSRGSAYFRKPLTLAIDTHSHFATNVYPRKNKRETVRTKDIMANAELLFYRGGHPESGIDDKPISDTLISSECASEVVAAARLQGFHFVVVLDGLDVLEITRSYRDRFDSLIDQTFQLANSNKRNGFALVVATRSSTLSNILKREYHDTYAQAIGEEYLVEPVKLRDVLRKRIAYIVKEVPILSRRTNPGWKIDDIDTHMSGFEEFLAQNDPLHGAAPNWQFVDTIQQVQGENVRAQMQMVQFRYYEYIVKRNQRRLPYHAVEAMLKAGRRFPPIAYRYSFDGSELVRSNWHHQKYDSRVFSFSV